MSNPASRVGFSRFSFFLLRLDHLKMALLDLDWPALSDIFWAKMDEIANVHINIQN
jgi:hypothetical protein